MAAVDDGLAQPSFHLVYDSCNLSRPELPVLSLREEAVGGGDAAAGAARSAAAAAAISQNGGGPRKAHYARTQAPCLI